MNQIPLIAPYSLRPLCAEDAQAIFDSIDTQREHLGRWLPFVAATLRVEQTQEVVTEMLVDTANPIFTIRSGDVFAGLIGFKSANPETRTIEIGYWMREEHQGRGVMTTAVRVLCDRAFGEMNMNRVEIRCAIGNHPSNGIPLRLGFQFEKTEPCGELLSDGNWTDINLYALEKQQ